MKLFWRSIFIWVSLGLVACTVPTQKSLNSDDNTTELPSIGDDKITFSLIDEIDGQELRVPDTEILLTGQDYVLSFPAIKSSGSRLNTKTLTWEILTTPENACTLTQNLDAADFVRILNCSSVAKVELTVSLPSASGNKVATIKRNFTAPVNLTNAGKVLYQQNCQVCHGVLSENSISGATANSIRRAFSSVPLMSNPKFLNLTPAQIRALAVAVTPTLAQPTPGPTPIPLTGAELYQNNCQACHLPLATSNKANKTAAQITTALQTVSLMQTSNLQNLTTAEIQSIASALAAPTPTPDPSPSPTPAPTPLDGATLYSNNCALCHAPLTVSSKRGRSASQINNAIGFVSSMQLAFLQSLTAAEVSRIADALYVAPAPTPTPTASPSPSPSPTPSDPSYVPNSSNGMNLYSVNCASCHSPLSSSQKKGRNAEAIAVAISSVFNMQTIPALQALTAQDIADIAAALSEAAPVTPVSLNYSMMEQRLRLFQSDSRTGTNDSTVDNAIKNYIFGGSEYVGGIFSIYEYKGHAQLPSLTFDAFEAKFSGKMNAPASSLRRGYITRSCEEIVFKDNLNSNFLARRGLTTSSPFTDDNIKTVFKIFIPGREPSASILSSLKNLGEQAKTNTGQSLEGWRFIILSLCTSSAGDLL